MVVDAEVERNSQSSLKGHCLPVTIASTDSPIRTVHFGSTHTGCRECPRNGSHARTHVIIFTCLSEQAKQVFLWFLGSGGWGGEAFQRGGSIVSAGWRRAPQTTKCTLRTSVPTIVHTTRTHSPKDGYQIVQWIRGSTRQETGRSRRGR